MLAALAFGRRVGLNVNGRSLVTAAAPPWASQQLLTGLSPAEAYALLQADWHECDHARH